MNSCVVCFIHHFILRVSCLGFCIAFYTGQECCSSGLECYYWDQYYSQCLPPQPTPAPTPTGCQPVFQQCGGCKLYAGLPSFRTSWHSFSLCSS